MSSEPPEERISIEIWSKALRLYPCARDERRTLQLQLLAALCQRSFKPPALLSALYSHGPWISAIGIRLQMYSRTAYLYRSRGWEEWVPPQRLVRILIEILRLLTKVTGLPRAGDVLRSCYSRGLLPQPAPADFESYRAHMRMICHAADLANIYYGGISLTRTYRYSPDSLQRFLKHYSTTDRLLQIPFAELMQATRIPSMDRHENLPRADGASFLVNDLDLGMLKVIGELSVEWTMRCDEHLLLDVEQQQLRIAWFSTDTYSHLMRSVGTLFR